MAETVVGSAGQIYCWPGPKMKATLFSAKLGALVLTDERLLFLSSGKSDALRKASLAAISPALGMRSQDTSSLDLSDLANDGSLDIPLADIVSCAAGKKRALVITHRDGGAEQSHTFGRQMGMPDRDAWIEQIEKLRR